jgi:hypothetical protein
LIDASTDYFGTDGEPTPSIDLTAVLESIIPTDFSSFYGSISNFISVEGPLPGDNTVPWSIYSCPELDIPPFPVTAVIVPNFPVEYPLPDLQYHEQSAQDLDLALAEDLQPSTNGDGRSFSGWVTVKPSPTRS